MNKYSQEDLLEFEKILMAKRDARNVEIQDYSRQISELSENGKDENGIENSGYEAQFNYLFSHKERAMKNLRDIENALSRIKNNTYGICVVTNALISKQRLLAVPTTTKSIEGKQLLEKQKS